MTLQTTFLPATRVQRKGQVTIPLGVRRKLNLKRGDLVTFVETQEGVLIKPAELIVGEALDKIGNVLKKRGIRLETLIKRGRNIRGELIAEGYNLSETPEV